ncbi:MAG TPA: hypothetical protein VD788_10785 [Candidatus Polarisedimenticolaceae bacterium]|nr:hypothetical protein [Candidatus Polarisedimenticolaceae bacterium]
MATVREMSQRDRSVHRFAFVIHPLHVGQIKSSPTLGWTRRLPDGIVERVAAYLPPFPVSLVTGARSPATGQRVEGQLLALGSTPKQMLRKAPEFTYRRLVRAAGLAASGGARLMGLGAFTSVVGDAGVTVACRAPIPITSGNSLTVSATIEAAKQAVRRMGLTELAACRATVVGATGSIGSVCARMLARDVRSIDLVSIEPDKLTALARLIRRETPRVELTTATTTRGVLGASDLVVSATSAIGQRVLDIAECKPGAVICDVARPPDVSAEEARLRPDVLVIESGEVLIPGEVDFHYDIGLPPGVSYACLAETALLAMDGRFECYTLGRAIELGRVDEIGRLAERHGFRLACLRSVDGVLSDRVIEAKRAQALALRGDEDSLARLRSRAASALASIQVGAKGVPAVVARGRVSRPSVHAVR